MGSDDRYGPPVVLTYAVPKLGKTVDMGFSFPRALYLAGPGALDAIVETCGYQPDQEEIGTVEQATARIRLLAAKQTHTEVVVDDFSVMAEITMANLEAAKTPQKDFWSKLRAIVLDFRNAARFAGVTVAINCWEAGPTYNEKTGVSTIGGPMLSGKLKEQVPGLCDMVLRGVHEPARKPWPVAYRCNPDPKWVTGDRLNVAQQCDPIPMNLGELIRARGRFLPRLIEGQEEEVEAIAQHLLQCPDKAWVAEAESIYANLANEYGRAHAVWSVRDGLDRATIRKDMARFQSTFYTPKRGASLATAKV
jgi:hypothetical protein